jgi:hypothetical protein
MTRRPHGALAATLAARLATLLPGRPSPFVTQGQLIDLVATDRRDIARQVRHAQQLSRRPHRGMPAAPYLVIADWTRFLRWTDVALRHLEQPRPVAELEHLIRTWQQHRKKIAAPTLTWHRRADVIAV